MLSPSEFNNAVPKFTNGNYANNPVDPQYIEEPTLQDYNRGVEPLETLPAQWWNWLCNQFTSRFNKINTYVKNIFDEITQLLSLLNISPDGTESAITTGQLKNFFKEPYPTYVSDKLELGTTYAKQTTTVNGHALSGNITLDKSDVGLGNVPNVSTNDQTPTYTEASALTALSSGEKLSIAFGKLAKAVSSIISHINNTNNPHSVTKAQVQLGNVVNTGDSATPVENGTTKFTTGGAYTELGKKMNGYTISYASGQPTIPTNKYILIFERAHPVTYYGLAIHLIGEFGKIVDTDKQFFDILIDFRNAQYGVILNAVTNEYRNIFDVIATWDNNTSTARVYLEVKDGYASASINAIDGMPLLGTLTTSSSMLGTPSAMTFLSQYTIVQKNIKDSLAPFFRTSVAYAVGDYVLYNSLLYKCTTAHSAGAWNSNHFTAVTVGNELEALGNKIDNANVAEKGGTGKYIESIKQEGGLIVPVEQTIDTAPVNASTKPITSGSMYNFFGGNTDAKSWLSKAFGWAMGRYWNTCLMGGGSLLVSLNRTVYTIYYANNLWVAGSDKGIIWSEDGEIWDLANGTAPYTFKHIYYANGMWVACSTGQSLWWSTDGKTWTQGEGINTNYVYYAKNIWVACSESHGMYWSSNGRTWTQGAGSNTSYTFNDVYYGNNIWVASSDSHGLWWSSNGRAWTQGTGSNTNYTFNSVRYADNIWVAGSDSHGLWWSSDGKAWNSSYIASTTVTINYIYYANGMWQACGEDKMFYSSDGKNFKPEYNPFLANCRSVYYANGTWVAGTDKGLIWSINGKNWQLGKGNERDNYSQCQFLCVYFAKNYWLAGGIYDGAHSVQGFWYSDFDLVELKD